MIHTASDRRQSTSNHPSPLDSTAAQSKSEQHPPTVLAGTDQGLYILPDDLQADQTVELEGKAITALATRPSSDSSATEPVELWAIADQPANQQTVWHRSAQGEWASLGSGFDQRLHCLLPLDRSSDPALLLGTSAAHLIQLSHGDIQALNSFEQAAGRQDWYTPWGGPPDVRSLAISPEGDLYVNVHVGGILRSSDHGQSWQPTIDFHADVHEVKTLIDAPHLVLAATAEGMAWSEDRGQTWQFDRANLHATYARAIAIGQDYSIGQDHSAAIVLLSVSLGPSGSKSALYRRRLDQPGSFQKCHQGLPDWFDHNINTGCLATWDHWAAFGTQTGQIFYSNDAGSSWQEIASGLPPIRCLSLTAGAQ